MRALLALSALGLSAGCSLIFPFSECDVGGDCPSGECLDGVCAPPPVDVARPVEGSLAGGDVWQGTIVMTGPVYVPPGQTLNIAPGTVIRGQRGSALIVRPGGLLLADATADAPIVFTSAAAERKAGDWGGVALLGDAPIVAEGGRGRLEGAPNGEVIEYGGDDPRARCGVLRYVRIEFAGQVLAENEELNGLTLAGCGTGTFVDHVQVHRGKDDGVEVFGGTVNLSHIVVTGALDDAFDYDLGWQGGLRFLAVTQLGDDGTPDPSGIEGSGQAAEGDPVPLIYNVTLLGCPDCPALDTPDHPVRLGVGLRLKGGASGELGNLLVGDWYAAALALKDEATLANLESGALRLGPAVMRLSASGVPATSSGLTEAFDVEAWLLSLAPEDDVPSLSPTEHGPAWILAHTDAALDGMYAGPAWVPDAGTFVGKTADRREDERIGAPAPYFGAFSPGGSDWTAGWTAYPER